MISAGDVIHCKIPFEDGTTNLYKRFFLVYETSDEYMICLNISSIAGKDKKLVRYSNKELINAIPPMRVRSMVKLDTLYKVDMFENVELYKHGTLSAECFAAVEEQKIIYDCNPSPATRSHTLICSKSLFDANNGETRVS